MFVYYYPSGEIEIHSVTKRFIQKKIPTPAYCRQVRGNNNSINFTVEIRSLIYLTEILEFSNKTG